MKQFGHKKLIFETSDEKEPSSFRVLIPRMATINETIEFLNEEAKKTNTKNCITAHGLRQMVKDNQIAHVRSGTKIIINIDKLIEYLNIGYTSKIEA